jgi:hypothetical protein
MKNQQQANLSKRGARMGCAAVIIAALIIAAIVFVLATENYSEGERIGFLTKFSKKGRVWKSWEGELNLTQTGMNTSSLFEFSIDNDNEDPQLIKTIDSAVTNGWKVKLTYHETFAKNWFRNRGETNHFVTGITVLSKNPVTQEQAERRGRIIDTIFVVIDKTQLAPKQ